MVTYEILTLNFIAFNGNRVKNTNKLHTNIFEVSFNYWLN